jgi:gliding motility-associated lipoprotein GldH
MAAHKKTIFFLTGALLLLTSCGQTDVFEKNTSIPSYKWSGGFEATGSFIIKDTGIVHTAYIVLRHTDAYKYSNIWLNFGLQLPGDSMRHTKVNIELGTDAGGWMGSGMDDIWEMRQLINLPFNKPGTYKYSISQLMRDEPLQHIMSAGLRIEKARP